MADPTGVYSAAETSDESLVFTREAWTPRVTWRSSSRIRSRAGSSACRRVRGWRAGCRVGAGRPAGLHATYALCYAKAAAEDPAFQPGTTDRHSPIVTLRTDGRSNSPPHRPPRTTPATRALRGSRVPGWRTNPAHPPTGSAAADPTRAVGRRFDPSGRADPRRTGPALRGRGRWHRPSPGDPDRPEAPPQSQNCSASTTPLPTPPAASRRRGPIRYKKLAQQSGWRATDSHRRHRLRATDDRTRDAPGFIAPHPYARS